MKKIIKLFVICTMAYLCNITAMGQEKIIEVDNHLDETSIIRAVNTKEWLVCDNNNGWSTFSLIDETLPTTQQIYLGNVGNSDKIQIYDFEVFNDTVYFCGSVWFGENQQAVWGYFPLAGFPYVSVKYIIRDIKSLTKLDVFSIDPTGNEIHVVMVGEQTTNRGVMVDEIRTAPGTFIEYTSDIYDVVYKIFNDIAETDTYVVMTMHDGGMYYSGGQVLFINKPTTLNTTMFSSSAHIYSIPGSLSAGLLEHCQADAIVVAYREIMGSVGVHSFTGPFTHANINISGDKIFSEMDLKFDKTYQDLDVLVKGHKNLFLAKDTSMILHLNQSLVSYGGPVFCHKYKDDFLNSLDWFSWGNYGFVASGHDKTNNFLRVYKYQYNNWGNCTEQEILEAKKKQMDVFSTCPFQYNSCEIVLYDYYASEKEVPLIIKCN